MIRYRGPMEFKNKFENDLKDAMRAGNNVVRDTLRMILSNIKLAEVEKGEKLDDSAILSLLQKELKLRQETIQDAQKGNRNDIIEASNSEIHVIESYLPKQMPEVEVIEIAKKVISQTNAVEMKDMGRVMKEMIPLIQGKASNDVISRVVRALLAKE
jgi:uncharacterized protein YqeY